MDAAPGLEALLAHAEWVRALARSLLRDPARAADLEQELWLRVLRRPPPALDDPRPWLATVLRRLAFTGARSGQRRREHEGRAGAERGPSAAAEQVLLEAERARDLAALVLELASPEREVVLLRYYRDLPPRRIAAELGRPLATVKSQLHRGLAELRSRLDRRHGGREAWAALFGPLAFGRGSEVALTTKLALGALAAGVVALAWTFAARRAPEQARVSELLAAAPARTAAEPDRAAALVRAEGTRAQEHARLTPAPEPSTSTAPPRFAAPEYETLSGRLLSPLGEPWPGVRVRAEDRGRLAWSDAEQGALVAPGVYLLVPSELRSGAREALAEFVAARFAEPREALALVAGTPLAPDSTLTDARGLFRLTVRKGELGIVLEDPLVALLGRGPPRETLRDEGWAYFATRATTLRGTVLDATGVPLPGVSVEAHMPAPTAVNALLALGSGLLGEVPATHTDERGEFTLAGVPGEVPFWLMVTSEDVSEELFFQPDEVPEHVELRLAVLPSAERPVLTGRVVRADGVPVAGALVLLGNRVAEGRPDGRFRLGLDALPAGEALIVLAPGFDPRKDDVLGARLAGASGLIELGDLALPATTLELAGRVVDAAGRPLAGLRVALADPTHAPALGRSLESLAGANEQQVETDSEGKFELRGLFPRPYLLELEAGETEARFGPFQPSRADLVLRVLR